MSEPRIFVPYSEYYRELRYIRMYRERLRRYRSRLGYHLAKYRWTGNRRYLGWAEYYRRLIRETEEALRRELERFRRKVRWRWWRLQLVRTYWSRRRGVRYRFEAEYRVYVYTANPERWRLADLEQELNLMEYLISESARRMHSKWARSVEWSQGDLEVQPVEPGEVEYPPDEPHYYARITKEDGAVHVYYDRDVKMIFANARARLIAKWIRGLIRTSPFRLMSWARYMTLDDWVRYG